MPNAVNTSNRSFSFEPFTPTTPSATTVTTISTQDLSMSGHNDLLHAKRIASFTLNLILCLFLIYVMLALFYHGFKRKRLIGFTGSFNDRRTKQSIINSIVLFATFTTFLNALVKIMLFIFHEQVYCDFYAYATYATYGISIVLLYFALWYRVHICFYADPVLSQNISKTLRMINKISIVILFVMAVAIYVTSVQVYYWKETTQGCQLVEKDSSIIIVLIIIFVVTTEMFQLTLLFLFIYPLYMHRRNMLNRRGYDATTTIAIIKRSAIVACICVISDITAAALTFVDSTSTYSVSHFFYIFNLFINLMGVILSFTNWKDKLLPFNRETSLPQNNKSSVSYVCENNNLQYSISKIQI